MKKLRFGTPEKFTPVSFCENFSFSETEVAYPTEKIEFFENARGCALRLPLKADEQIYGLGLQLKQMNLKGKKMTVRVNADPVAATGDSHAPVPFFVSTAGYGIYVDTLRNAEFYFGSSALIQSNVKRAKTYDMTTSTEELYANNNEGNGNISIQIPAAKGVDIYIIEGENILDVVKQYNMMAGGGCDVPEWGLKPIYRCHLRYSQEKVLQMAHKFRDEGYKIGIIGLEPGWMTHAYSASYIWNEEKYPAAQEMINELKAMDFHVNLWEHGFVNPSAPFYKEILPYCADYAVWEGGVPDFSLNEAKKIFADYHKKIVAMGVDGFKIDECDSSDITGGWSFPNMAEFPSGMDGEQYHSAFGVLYMQTMLNALGETKTLSEVRSGGALAASYPFVLYSDLYNHSDFVRGCATSGFSGLLWTPEVREAKSKEAFLRRLQSNVFSVQCIINAWYCEEAPWLGFNCENEVKELFEIREGLIPMLKAAFEKYKNEGVPPVRALVCDYTDDKETHNIDNQYVFCDSLIVAPILAGETKRKVYLPDGKWCDYFTKEPVNCGWFEVETQGIPVYEKIK